jgi:hypothetical protein
MGVAEARPAAGLRQSAAVRPLAVFAARSAPVRLLAVFAARSAPVRLLAVFAARSAPAQLLAVLARWSAPARLLGGCAALLLSACGASTGGALVQFSAVARGEGAASFTTTKGYTVDLTRARLFVGAVYLNQTTPGNYAGEVACVLPGVYSGEVRAPLTVDALSPLVQPFPKPGVGTAFPSKAGELWLTSGDINAPEDKQVLLEVAGTARKGAEVFPFDGALTIGANRAQPPRDTNLPGSNPLCRQRIVTPIPLDVVLADSGTLTLTVKPSGWFDNVEFSQLDKVSDSPLLYRFQDVSEGQPSTALYTALRASQGVYSFGFTAP